MYDITVALRRFRGLIRWTARKYSILGDFRRSREDLEAEGLLVLVKCCQSFPEGGMYFARYFKRAWYNRLKKMIRFSSQKKRQGTEIELLEALSIPDVVPDSREYLLSKAEEFRPHLDAEVFRLLQMLVEPDEQVIEFAWRDFCRKNKLRSQGQRVPGWKQFRVRARHIRSVLRISPSKMRRSIRQIRRVSHLLHGGKSA